MALKVKAVERLLKFDKNDAGTYRYVMTPELYASLEQRKVIREAALRSGVNQGVMQACWDAAGEVIKAWATEGHSVALPGLGTMRFGLRSKSVTDVNDVKRGLIKSRRIIFTPSVDLKDELANTSIIITCIDRNGNEVKRVTSDDEGIVEENQAGNTVDENESTDSGNGGSTGGSSAETVRLTVSAGNGGKVKIGDGEYGAGANTDVAPSTVVTITAQPNAGYSFSQWSDGNTSASRSVTVSAAMTLTASFTLNGGGDNGGAGE